MTQGDSCPFRHCEAAIGSETVCTLWQEGRCFRNTCKFRHMEITIKVRTRKSQGDVAERTNTHPVILPDVSKNVEQLQEEPASIQPPATNPQRRDAIKMDAQVPSPTHPPVVINPAEDEDEDEDGDSLHFGVSTVEEIRLKKALKASMRKAGYPLLDEKASANKEKENIQALCGAELSDPSDGPLFEVLEETGGPKADVTERLGKKRLPSDVRRGENASQSRRLGDRLGTIMPTEALPAPSFKDEAKAEPHKSPGQFHVKTLKEIRLEKAARLKDCPSADAPETSSNKAAKSKKRVLTTKDQSSGPPRTFAEVCSAKRRKVQEQQPSSGTEKVSGQSQPEESAAAGSGPAAARPGPVAPNPTGIQVKTLEEIRREKAARLQSKPISKAESTSGGEKVVKKTRLLKISKASLTASDNRFLSSHQTPVANGNGVKVKTFEEIMQEKRLRKQELEEQARGSAQAEPLKKQTAVKSLKRRTPAMDSSLHNEASSPKTPVRKLISLKSKSAPPFSTRANSQSPNGSKKNQDHQSKACVGVKRARVAEEPEQDQPADPKVRPKLNVKPSVMKPAVQLKPAQKRRGAQRSAVAAVKPLNSSVVPEQETAFQSADAQASPAVPCGDVAGSGSGSSPLKEELQTVPVMGQGRETPSGVPAVPEACAVPQR
ncbi:unnamed protein product [Tetraodon nigroviridis]|uniref:(spotted green pufferfish) hypothetical protein n=1 Tax=Tetraodon nigroviridis TaxID=99883 RepID=Q4T4K4_TETNG|nr:unnamed protein product [Tetraodon nigroviridis]